jgi:8-oxo-dGTP diphosphatase
MPKRSPDEPPQRPIPAVGVVCLRAPDKVLLIRRSKPPGSGSWSLPGGRVEWGESLKAAALRELCEETGVEGEMLGLIDVVDGRFEPDQDGTPTHHFILVDYAVRWTDGEPHPGGDAAAAHFFTLDQITDLDLWDETLRIIRLAADRWPPNSGADPTG